MKSSLFLALFFLVGLVLCLLPILAMFVPFDTIQAVCGYRGKEAVAVGGPILGMLLLFVGTPFLIGIGVFTGWRAAKLGGIRWNHIAFCLAFLVLLADFSLQMISCSPFQKGQVGMVFVIFTGVLVVVSYLIPFLNRSSSNQ